MKTLLAILRLVRFPLIFTAFADASVVVCLRAEGLDWPALAGLWAAAGGLYVFGMAGNDLFDVRRDRRALTARRTGRVNPVASGEIPVALAAGITLAGAATAAAAAALSPAVNPWMTLAVAGMALAYNAGAKLATPVGLVMLGGIRAANAAQGLVGDDVLAFWAVPAILGGHVIFVSAFAHAWEHKRPPLHGNNWFYLLALCAAALLCLALARRHLQVNFWPAGEGLGCVAGAWGLFVAVFFWIFLRAPAGRRGPLLILIGLSWLIVLDGAFVLAAGLTRASWVFAGLLAAVIASSRAVQYVGQRCRRPVKNGGQA